MTPEDIKHTYNNPFNFAVGDLIVEKSGVVSTVRSIEFNDYDGEWHATRVTFGKASGANGRCRGATKLLNALNYEPLKEQIKAILTQAANQ